MRFRGAIALVIAAALYQRAKGTQMGDGTKGGGGSLPRGLRNNNPGNIEKGQNWQGLDPDQSGDERFAVFVSPQWGIRAMAVIIRNYARLYGLRTISGIIGRWAPAHENNVSAYVDFVSRRSGIGPGVGLNLTDGELAAIIPAMIEMENGVQPYSPAVIMAGIRRA